jgi:hypothetical protein
MAISDIATWVTDATNQIKGIGGAGMRIANAAAKYKDKINTINDVLKYVNGAGGTTGSHIRDLYTNGFLSSKSVIVPTYFARAFDEPTYLTFRIKFHTNSNDCPQNYYYSGLVTPIGNEAEEYDFMPEPFLMPTSNPVDVKTIVDNRYTELQRKQRARTLSRNEEIEMDQLKSINDLFEVSTDTRNTITRNNYSTLEYLEKNLGEDGRAALLEDLINEINDIQTTYPFYFKSISGLDGLMNVDSARGTRVSDGTKITLSCYEGLDLKINQILQRYKKIVWDDVYQRWVLPDMMRYFSMSIYISEVRLFHSFKSAIGKITKYNELGGDGIDWLNATNTNDSAMWESLRGSISKGISAASVLTNKVLGTNSTVTNVLGMATDITSTADSLLGTYNMGFAKLCNNAINSIMPTIELRCHMCEFDISNVGSSFSELASAPNQPTEATIDIKVGQVEEIQTYPLSKHIEYDGNTEKVLHRTFSDKYLTKNYNNFKIKKTDYTYLDDLRDNVEALNTPLKNKYPGYNSALFDEIDKLEYYIHRKDTSSDNLVDTIISDAYNVTNTLDNILNNSNQSSATSKRLQNRDNIISNKSEYDREYEARHAQSSDASSVSSVGSPVQSSEVYDPYQALASDGTSSVSRENPYGASETTSTATDKDNGSHAILTEALEGYIERNLESKYGIVGSDWLNAVQMSLYKSDAISSTNLSESEKSKLRKSMYLSILENMSKSIATNSADSTTIENTYKALQEPEHAAMQEALDEYIAKKVNTEYGEVGADWLKAIALELYKSPIIDSMDASDAEKNAIRKNVYLSVLDSLSKSLATDDTIMRNMIDCIYDEVSKEEKSIATHGGGTSNGFDYLNGKK